ncbi:MAG: kelch repeat-containing protein, partial [Thermoplasmata archaeon]
MKKLLSFLMVLLVCSTGLSAMANAEKARHERDVVSSIEIPANTWYPLTQESKPSARYQAEMVYYEIAGVFILFGGRTGTNQQSGETWEYNPKTNTWRLLNPLNSPPARLAFGMAYDTINHKIVLFGGFAGTSTFYSDTWVYDYSTNTWTNMNPSVKPPSRYGCEMVFDKKNGVFVLFGGVDSNWNRLSDTWVYSYGTNTWTQKITQNTPPKAEDPAFGYDEKTGKCILFGGANVSSLLSETWAYDYAQNTWQKLSPLGSPTPRWLAEMVFAPTIQKLILFGGATSADEKSFSNETWTYDSGTNSWVQLNFQSLPSARGGYVVATDGNNLYYVGGHAGNNPLVLLSDSWLFDATSLQWFCLEPTERPSARRHIEVVYHESADVFILFGGRTSTNALNSETWVYYPRTNIWRNMNPVTAPSPRDSYAMAYDSLHHKLVLFGGRTSTNSCMSDTWVYDYGTNSWSSVYPSVSPPGRYGHEMVFDKKNGVFVMYGGVGTGYTHLSDTWVYDYSTNTWTQKLTSQNPGGIEEHALAYDENSGKCILFGGNTGTSLKAETWAYDYSTNSWTKLPTSIAPSGRWVAKMSYVSVHQKIILFGGACGVSGSPYSNETWAYSYSANTWILLNLSKVPQARGAHALATDGKSVYVFYGDAGAYPTQPFNDTWVLNLGTAPSPPRNLVAKAGHGKIFLQWETPGSDGGSPITSYKIYRGTSSGNLTYLTTVGNQLNYTDAAVTVGTTYYYAVSAVNTIGESGLSNEASATPLSPSVPSVPRNFTVVSSFENVTLGWEPPLDDGGTPVIGYRLYRGNTSTNLLLYAELGNQLTYKDTNVSVGKVYYYALSALNNIGEGNKTGVLEAEVYGYGVPSSPRNLVAEIGDRKITLSWIQPASDGGSAITNYRIYRSTASGTETPFAIIGNFTTYTDTNVTAGTTYYYQVAAINAIGEGNKSNEANATAATTPAPPKNLTGYFDAAGSVV